MADKRCTVLVTGGAGFLGQHVVGLLQTRADHVTDIVVLDVVQYENKLDYEHRKPIRSIIGSITDLEVVLDACRDVDSVIHIAGVADPSMFPDSDRIQRVNIFGTLTTILAALRTSSVRRFVYCSSTSVGIGYDSDVSGCVSESDPLPRSFIFEPYASSKLAGERIVSSANGEGFRVVSIRPMVMYGELDVGFVTLGQKMASDIGGTLISVACGDVKQHQAYVGNVAWGFVCAEKKLFKEQKFCHTRYPLKVELNKTSTIDEYIELIRRRSENQSTPKDVNDVGGKVGDKDTSTSQERDLDTKVVYYIVDDTPPANPFAFQEQFLTGTGYKMSPIELPIPLAIFLFFILYWVLRFLRLFSSKFNYPVSVSAIRFLRKPFIFNDQKARSDLGYSPIYTREESIERSMRYYMKNAYKR